MLTNPAPALNSASELSSAKRNASIRLGNLDIRSTVFMAPLSGITDVPFRRLVLSFGTPVVYSEMIASGEILKGNAESLSRAAAAGTGIHAVQLAGREPAAMCAAASWVAGEGADIIDINMGCPAKKVVGGLSGSALMRDLEMALRLIEATVAGAGSIPVTVKMRLGWDQASVNAPELARRAEAAGAQLVTVHGRTRDQFYDGKADWNAIAAVKAAVSIPVVANGDLVQRDDALAMQEASGADAVMIGRGACGRPWFPAVVDGCIAASALQTLFAELVVEHYDAMLEHYGVAVGVRHARKHLGWYLDRFSVAVGASLHTETALLLRSSDPANIRTNLRHLLSSTTLAEVDHDAVTALRKAA